MVDPVQVRLRQSEKWKINQLMHADGAAVGVVRRHGWRSRLLKAAEQCAGKSSLLMPVRRAVPRCVQGRYHDFNVFTMNCRGRSISIEQDADAIDVDAPA